jgi:hypothetical protein
MFLGVVSVAPSVALSSSQQYPRLTPWAASLRRFAAGFDSAFQEDQKAAGFSGLASQRITKHVAVPCSE